MWDNADEVIPDTSGGNSWNKERREAKMRVAEWSGDVRPILGVTKWTRDSRLSRSKF